MGRIEKCFETLKSEGKKGLVTFITSGDPCLESTLRYMNSLVSAGADIIELGVPFSDPMADGPTIQRSSERSLLSGTDLSSIFEVVKKFRKRNDYTPIILMGYMNPFERFGFEKFAKEAKSFGVDGVLVVDLPPEESSNQNRVLRENEIGQVFLVAPNSSTRRIEMVGEFATGFIYFVSVKGVTGDKSISADLIKKELENVRLLTKLPIALGFGIKTPEDAKEAVRLSDAIVVGSALVEIIEMGAASEDVENLLEKFVMELRKAIDG